MKEQIRLVFQQENIAVPEDDIPILQELWTWVSGLRERTKEMEAGSYDIAITHLIKEDK